MQETQTIWESDKVKQAFDVAFRDFIRKRVERGLIGERFCTESFFNIASRYISRLALFVDSRDWLKIEYGALSCASGPLYPEAVTVGEMGEGWRWASGRYRDCQIGARVRIEVPDESPRIPEGSARRTFYEAALFYFSTSSCSSCRILR